MASVREHLKKAGFIQIQRKTIKRMEGTCKSIYWKSDSKMKTEEEWNIIKEEDESPSRKQYKLTDERLD